MLDYYVVTSLSGKSSEGQLRNLLLRAGGIAAAMDKALDGQKDRRNWKLALLEVLGGWLRLFPKVVSKNRGRLSFGSATHAQPSAVSLDRAWTTSELNIVPCNALQAVDQTGQLRPDGCGFCFFPFNDKHERRSKH